MSHLYFNEERDYSEENTCESLSLHHFPLQKETKHIQVSAADILYTVLEQEISIDANARSSHWCSITNSILKNFTKFTAKQLRQSLFFNKVVGLRQLFFTEQFLTTASEMQKLSKRSKRNRLSLLQSGKCNASCFSQNPRARGKNVIIQLLWASRVLVLRVSLTCHVDEFLFWFLVFLSFCFWCYQVE